jgi:hypothetical protein
MIELSGSRDSANTGATTLVSRLLPLRGGVLVM